MKTIFIALIATVFLALVAAVLTKRSRTKKSAANYGYKRRKPLSQNEENMYWRLVKSLPNHVILPQVGLSRCISTNGQAAFNTIARKSLDFVICDRAMQIIAAIEIDDKTHAQSDRAKADATKNQACNAAGIKLIRWPGNPLPSEETINNYFNTKETA